MEIPAASSAASLVACPLTSGGSAASHAAMYDKPEFVGHSFWIVPPVAIAEKLAAVISELASSVPSLASAGCPVFNPHMTLLSGLRGLTDEFVVSRAAELAADLRTLKIDLIDIAQGPKFFQCVFAVAQQTPALMAANAAGQSAFGLTYDFIPHVSLVYGDHVRIGDAGKAAAVAKAKHLLRSVQAAASGVELSTAEEAGAPILSFDASTLEIWSTAGPVSAWRKIAAFELGARDAVEVESAAAANSESGGKA